MEPWPEIEAWVKLMLVVDDNTIVDSENTYPLPIKCFTLNDYKTLSEFKKAIYKHFKEGIEKWESWESLDGDIAFDNHIEILSQDSLVQKVLDMEALLLKENQDYIDQIIYIINKVDYSVAKAIWES